MDVMKLWVYEDQAEKLADTLRQRGYNVQARDVANCYLEHSRVADMHLTLDDLCVIAYLLDPETARNAQLEAEERARGMYETLIALGLSEEEARDAERVDRESWVYPYF